MKKLVIGTLAIIIGLPGFSFFVTDFLTLVLGTLPVLLILGGSLAAYLGYEDIKTKKKNAEKDNPPEISGAVLNREVETAEPSADTPEKQENTREAESAQGQKKPVAPETQNEPVKASEPAEPRETSPGEPSAPAFLGNTDTQVFHSIECNFSKGKKCTLAFTTREEAMDQGYKPCKVCNP